MTTYSGPRELIDRERGRRAFSAIRTESEGFESGHRHVRARPCRAGVLNAEPGGGRAAAPLHGAALDLMRLNSAAAAKLVCPPSGDVRHSSAN